MQEMGQLLILHQKGYYFKLANYIEYGFIYIRHGDDFVRPLTVEGTMDVTHVAEWLNDLGVEFDAIITSPLKRAQQSASIVSKIFNIENNLMNWEEL